MSLLNSNTTVDTITWNSTLRPKVGLSVLHNGATWINTTGSNSEPGIGSDWVSGGGSPLEETVIGTALYDAAVGGTYDLDLSTFVDFYGVLTSNTVLTVSNTPEVGKSFVRNAIFKSSTTETLDLPNTWNINGDYDTTTGVENNFTIKFSNFPTVGLIVTCDIWQNE